ncbi:MAG: hypothetical protein U5K81_00540 [Trueperaceae bacterium]|nr:hypothetical protein [Trueperaceae bacterium]
MAAEVLDVLRQHVIIPVIREADVRRAELVIEALHGAGFRVFEITMTVPGATDLARDLTTDPAVTVGVGTVLTAHDARRATEAGARFVVSPAGCGEVAAAAHEGGAAAILGGLTPTEILTARGLGADAIKIFPADSVGGPAHVKSVGAVFPELPLIPTGGVNLDNLRAHLGAGAHSVGVGSALSKGTDRAAIEASARRYLDAAHPRPESHSEETL